ncbi:hypothetical protein T440DRAFT_468335 [Plenodomus tracheiphilus IPT5]|uniref:U three protein 23 n=1 Tax=Plenodomus tracheiphilus IPT5 TaxID=1408161 RepID=A0A6A7B5J3_9PLEO|nr:hypothetical protein T440DRAFT_468335 [Plenodomus tracheiphilus IPT5]
MKLKRAKAYKKLLHQYELNFGFREPYQVLLDSQILEDAYRCKIDLVARLQKMLGGQVKPMITTCDMRHLYLAKPKNETLILQAKEYERRRCNHQDLEKPLSTLECLSSVVDPKDNNTNKFRYIVCSNDVDVRKRMRRIAGVPLIYISKSVVLMEPMANATEEVREREEKSKFKMGLKGQRKPDAGEKRKRDDDEARDEESTEAKSTGDAKSSKKRQKGPKGPNPLSVKKAKKDQGPPRPKAAKPAKSAREDEVHSTAPDTTAGTVNEGEGDGSAPRKRRRKHKSKAETGAATDGEEAGSP